MVIDSHAHLNDSRLNANQIIADMKKDNLEKIISVGYDLRSSIFNLNLAKNNDDIYCSLGIHPSDVKKIKEEDLQKIESLADDEKVVAIGEIGLDYHYPDTDKNLQQFYLKKQMEIVKRTSLPAIIHLRDAYEDMQKIVSANLDCFKKSAVMHCFSGSRQTALYYTSIGFYISFSGVITFEKSNKFEEIIRAIPRDKLLIETDCPYLTPHPYRGKLNYPKYVNYTAERVAEILNKPIEYVEELTKENTYNLFTKMKK